MPEISAVLYLIRPPEPVEGTDTAKVNDHLLQPAAY